MKVRTTYQLEDGDLYIHIYISHFHFACLKSSLSSSDDDHIGDRLDCQMNLTEMLLWGRQRKARIWFHFCVNKYLVTRERKRELGKKKKCVRIQSIAVSHSPPTAFKTRSPGDVPFFAAAGDLTEHQCPAFMDLIYMEWVNIQIWPHEGGAIKTNNIFYERNFCAWL